MIHKIASVQAIALSATWDKVFGSWERVAQSLLNPLREGILATEFVYGHLVVPQEPGLGVETDEAEIRQFEALRLEAHERS